MPTVRKIPPPEDESNRNVNQELVKARARLEKAKELVAQGSLDEKSLYLWEKKYLELEQLALEQQARTEGRKRSSREERLQRYDIEFPDRQILKVQGGIREKGLRGLIRKFHEDEFMTGEELAAAMYGTEEVDEYRVSNAQSTLFWIRNLLAQIGWTVDNASKSKQERARYKLRKLTPEQQKTESQNITVEEEMPRLSDEEAGMLANMIKSKHEVIVRFADGAVEQFLVDNETLVAAKQQINKLPEVEISRSLSKGERAARENQRAEELYHIRNATLAKVQELLDTNDIELLLKAQSEDVRTMMNFLYDKNQEPLWADILEIILTRSTTLGSRSDYVAGQTEDVWKLVEVPYRRPRLPGEVEEQKLERREERLPTTVTVQKSGIELFDSNYIKHIHDAVNTVNNRMGSTATIQEVIKLFRQITPSIIEQALQRGVIKGTFKAGEKLTQSDVAALLYFSMHPGLSKDAVLDLRKVTISTRLDLLRKQGPGGNN
jgi:hypothetical protein